MQRQLQLTDQTKHLIWVEWLRIVNSIYRCEGWWSRVWCTGRFMQPSMRLMDFPPEVPGISFRRYTPPWHHSVEKIWIQWRKETLSHTHFDTIKLSKIQNMNKKKKNTRKAQTSSWNFVQRLYFLPPLEIFLGTKWK